MAGRIVVLVTALVVTWVSSCQGQDIIGSLLPGLRRENLTPRIRTLHIYSDIKFRFASTLVTSHMHNPSPNPRTAVFDVVLPNQAFISNFTLEIDDKVYPGVVVPRDTNETVTNATGPLTGSSGSVSARPRETNRFTVKVTVAGWSEVTFNLTYQEVLSRRQGVYEHVVYVNPGQIVEDLKIEVSILETRDITLLRVPAIRRNELISPEESNQDSLVLVQQPTKRSAYVRFQPEAREQAARWRQGVQGSFVVIYDVKRDYDDSGDVLVVNGYFVHFFAPRVEDYIPRDILFVLDLSTSMSGRKLMQLQEAMRAILKDLRPEDRFNLLLFNTDTWMWDNSRIVEATPANIVRAVDYIDSLTVGGFTNIDDALMNGLNFLNRFSDRENSSMLIFLTDGQPTHGLLDPSTILGNVRDFNILDTPIFSLAFGEAADWAFCKMLATQNNGISRRIYEAADAQLQIAGFYHEIGTTLLSDVGFHYLEDAVVEDTVTSMDFLNYFNGSELVVTGRLSPNATRLPLTVQGMGAEGKQLHLKAIAALEGLTVSGVPALIDVNQVAQITEKVWAYLTIKDLLRERDAALDLEYRRSLTQGALALALQYQLVTPVTSMIVTIPGVHDEKTLAPILDEDGLFGSSSPSRWSVRGGRDPHIVVESAGLRHPLCFDLMGQPGNVFRLIKDPATGMVINAGVNHGHLKDGHGMKRTYIHEMAIMLRSMIVHARINDIRVNSKRYKWTDHVRLELPEARVVIRPEVHGLRVEFHNGVLVKIRLHAEEHNATQHLNRDAFLNFDIDHEEMMSTKVTGLLGQFVHEEVAVGGITVAGIEEPGVEALLTFQTEHGAQVGTAKLARRHDPFLNGELLCWQLKHGEPSTFSLDLTKFLVKDVLGI